MLYKRLRHQEHLEPIPQPLTPLGMAWAKDYPFEKQTKLFVDEELFNPEFKDWLWDKGQLSIADIELFLNPANHSMPVHIDGETICDVCKINFAYCDSPSFMKWYKPLVPGTRGNLPYANGKPTNTVDMYWQWDGVEELESEEISIHLVNVGVPHSVTTTETERRCLSVNLDRIMPDGTEITEVPFRMGLECLSLT